MVGMPLAFSASTRGWNSDAPVRNPGTMIAALRFGRSLMLLLGVVVRGDGCDRASDFLEQSAASSSRRTC